MSDDLFDHPELKAYFLHAQREMFPKLKSSAVSIAIMSDDPDPKLCLELGAAILFDKPILALVPDDRPLPANLKRVAAAVVRGNLKDPRVMKELQEAIARITSNDQRSRQ